MWQLYKPRAGHTLETAVNRVSRVSSVAFWSQEHDLSPSATLPHITLLYPSSLSLLAQFPSAPPTSLQHLTPPPRPLLFISLSREWWWVANLSWFPLTLTSRVAGPAATSGPDLGFSQGGWEMGLAGLVGLGALTLPHVQGLEEGWGGETTANMKAPLKNTDLVRAPSFHLRNRSK